MCIILDTNQYSNFLNPENQDMKPVRDWLRRHGKIVYAETKQFETELRKHEEMRDRFNEYKQADKLRNIDKNKVNTCEQKLNGLKSNDGHIIALAQVANVKVLVSGDTKLHEDFKKVCGGKIYQNAQHKHLLNKDTCP